MSTGAPLLGTHDGAAFAAPGWRTAGVLPGTGRSGAPPLAGVTVLELAWFYAAPFGTALLADLGARVIRVESADGDPHRWQFPPPEFAAVKAVQGKESVIVDYRTPEGTEILHRLTRRADLVMRNYRQANSVQTGDDYDSLAAVNPDLVYLYAGAYGADGPYAARPAFAPTMSVAAGFSAHLLGEDHAIEHSEPISFDEGMTRLEHVTQRSGGPGRPPTNNGDVAPALVVATGMLLGLLAKARTGRGQYAETSMLCSNVYVVSDAAMQPPDEHADAHDENGTGPLYRLYPAREGWVFLAAPGVHDFARLRDAVNEATEGAVELDRGDARLADTIAGVLAARTDVEWDEWFVARGVTCVAVNQGRLGDFTIRNHAMTDNGWVVPVSHPLFGDHLRHGPVVDFSDTPGVALPGCTLGQHTRAVLLELGYSDDEAEDLRARGVVGWPD